MASLAGPQSESTDATAASGATGASGTSAWKPRSALTGTLLANRYKIADLVGQGSTGAVFRADDVISGKPVAVRVLVPALAQLPGLIPRIRARIDRNNAIQQRDPAALVNLVDIFDVGMTLEGELFVVSDYLDGDHLNTMLSRGGRLPWSRARSLLIRLCQIVHGLHQEGIVLGGLEARHCFAIRGKTKHEAIKVVNNAVIEQLASTIGPHAGHGATILARYVAPEQACGDPIDARSDVYSFGIIAYELLTGSVPFTDANPVRLVSMHLQRPPRPPREVAPDADIPAEVEEALLRSLAKDPGDRFATMDAFAAALTAVPESSQPTGTHTGAHAIVPASIAASEIPTGPADRSPQPTWAAESRPATTHELTAASPTPEPATSAPTAVAPSEPTAIATTAAAAAVITAAAPEPAPAPAAAAPEPAAASPATPPPATEPANLTAAAANVPTPGRRVASIPTHVTLPPGSMTSDIIRGVAPPPTLASAAARPATLPPTLGGLRLPPPPSLGRPATIPPGGLTLPPPPTLGAPTGAPTATPRAPSTASPSALPRLGSGVPVPSPRAPSAALPAGTLLRSGLAPSSSTSTAATDTPADLSAAPVPADSKPVPSDTSATPVPADSKPVPSDSSAAPVSEDSKPAPSDSSATPVAGPADSKPAASDSPLPPASADAIPPLAAAASKPAEEPRAASSTSSARRPVVTLTAARKEGDSASASGAYLRTAFTDTAATSAKATTPADRPADKPPEKPADRPRPVAAPSDDRLRSAALQHSQVTAPQAALSQIDGTTDSLVAEVPRSRGGLWVVLGLAAAAGIAALVFTSPSFTTPRVDPIATAPTKAPTKLADATTLPGTGKSTVQDPPPDRGVGVIDPETNSNPPNTPPTGPVDPPPSDPTPTAVPEPDDPEPTTKPGKKDPKKKKTPRVREEPEEPEKDVFDQLREHMAAKKAQEEAYKKAAGQPTPATTPTPTPTPVPATTKPEASEADKAKETLDRAKQAAASGNQALAYSLAKQSYGMSKTQEALELMGVSACRLKNVDNARSALGSLSGGRRDTVVSACNQAGVTL